MKLSVSWWERKSIVVNEGDNVPDNVSDIVK